ncbi:MAG: glycerophosphodiester phosphodiesterase family protein [Clostridia bacterium]|nr:glycerophosphodiester phosphodiesterase family protein [Clostridia bacterium]
MLLILALTVSCTAEPTEDDPPASVVTSQEVTEAPAVTEEDLSTYAPLPLIASRYTLICSSKAPEKVRLAAEELAGKIAEAEKVTPAVSTDLKTEASRLELLIGETDRAESIEAAESLGCMDYTVRIRNGKIVILGGSPLATVQAVRVFTEMLFDGRIENLGSDLTYDYDYDRFFADSLAFLADTFVPKWASSFTPPAWMHDYDEKVYALTCQSGRITSSSHRGDVVNYPENSLEAILSAIMLGADAVEIDIRLTKDNVMVLMHDETLPRTTDWNKKAGKNGLPKSPKIEDWTYEQLRELRLLYNGKPTESMIPTLYEAALLFGGRAQIHFDCKVSDKIDRNTDIYPLAEETGSKSSFFYSFGYDMMLKWLSYDSKDVEFREFTKKITIYLAQNGNSLRKSKFDLLAKYGDEPQGWKSAYNDGYKTVYTDNIVLFCRFSAAQQKPMPLP